MQSHLHQPRYAGINLGYGHVKLRTERGFLQYASIAVAQQGDASLMRANTQRVVVDGEVWEVGDQAALLAGANFDRRVFPNWSDSRDYRVLLQSVLERLAEQSLGPWRVVLGAPVSQFNERRYRQELIGRWRGRHATHKGELLIEHAACVPEPVGAFWHHAASNPDVNKKAVLVLDVGYFTTDAVVVQNLVLNPASGGSLNAGMEQVYRVVARMLNENYRLSPAAWEVETAVLGVKPFYFRDQAIDLQPLLHKALHGVGKTIVAWIRSVQGQRPDLILTCGGGAHVFTEPVRLAYPDCRVLMVKDAQAANAHGYHYLAKSVSSAASPQVAA